MERVQVALTHRAVELRLQAERRGGGNLTNPSRGNLVPARLQPEREVAGGGVGRRRRARGRLDRAAHQAAEIKRSARLGPGARQTAPTKGLNADDRADDVAVDVEIACFHPRGDMGDRLVEAGVEAKGQAIAGRVDAIDQRVEPAALVADDVKDRPEHLALQLGNVRKFDDRRRDKGAVRGRVGERERIHLVAAGAHRLDVAGDVPLRFGRDDWADVDRQPIGAADGEFLQRAAQHGEDTVGNFLLQAQDAQRRAALAGAVEGGGDDVGHHLFGERGAVDDHRILAARLGDQRDRRAIWRGAGGEFALDQPGDFG